jgi:rare lipoprotein A
MKLKRIAGVLSLFIITCLFWTGYSTFASAQKDNFEKKMVELSTRIFSHQKKDDIYYELHNVERGSIPASVKVRGDEVMVFSQLAGGMTPRERASIFVNKLRDFVQNNKNPWKIFPDFQDGIAVIKYEDEILLTADVKSAKTNGMNVSDLALKWANNIRRSLGAAELIRDYDLIKVIADKYDEIVGYYETGVASWYGDYFHGRTAADGSIYNMYQFTAAHKTLPFGSVVKVTNLKNGNSCVVKITDRGPFIDGRIIDLSRVAAEEIGMLHTGISKVKIEVIGKV